MRFSEQETRELVAEFIGTLMLVFVGAGAVITAPGNVVAAALAHGLILISIVGTFGYISGAHVNPAVSLAMWISGHLETRRAMLYMLAQFLGGIVAAVLLWAVIPDEGQFAAARTTLGQTTAASGVNSLGIFVVEGLITFFLVSTIYQVAVYGRGSQVAPVVIGVTLGAAILVAGALTGGAANPARVLGPAIFAPDTQDIGEVLVYLAATFGGGALAAFLHMDTFKPTDAEPTKAPGIRRLRRNG